MKIQIRFKIIVSVAAVLLLLLCANIRAAASVDLMRLHPRPKSAFTPRSGSGFTIKKNVVLVIADAPTLVTAQAAAYLQLLVKERIGDSLILMKASLYEGVGNAILLGEVGSFDWLTDELNAAMPKGETLSVAQGYVLDVNKSRIVLAGATPDGTFNSVSTLAQLMNHSGDSATVQAAHVWDYPDYPQRWVYSSHNLLPTDQVDSVLKIVDTMAFHKMNGMMQSDFKYNVLERLRQYNPDYFWNVDTFKVKSLLHNVEIIPAVAGLGWSDGILYHDPNLAEGLPAVGKYIVEGDTGRLLPDPGVSLPNGDFESVNFNNGQFTGWSWYDGPNQSVFVDSSIVHGGKYSARCTNFTVGNAGGNCRIVRSMLCKRNHYYVLSAWMKTQSYKGGGPQFLVAGISGSIFYPMTFTAFPNTADHDWMKVQVVFNTLQFDTIYIYSGVWGGQSGTIWWDDIQVQEGGLTNILRRAGTPLHVTNAHTGREYREGMDFDSVVDPVLNASHGTYGPYHSPPTFRRTSTSTIANGDTLSISYFHPFTSVSDENGNNSVMACVSEDTLYRILRDQISRVDTLYHPAKFFLSHDEIRNMNHDSACLNRHVSPAKLLSDNLMHCKSIVDSVHPGTRQYVWSDMFDSLHNAINNYYLINGDLTGDWRMIDTSLCIVNWNSTYDKQSLTNFSKMGFHQLSSPYYDVGNTSSIRKWRLAQEGVPNVDGMMYTTWANDYRFLTPFGDYAWSAGPYVIHTPLDSANVPALLAGQALSFTCMAIADSDDNTDAITSVHALIEGREGMYFYSHDLILKPAGNLQFRDTCTLPVEHGFRYHLEATNKQGLKRVTPTYIVGEYDYQNTVVREVPVDARMLLSIQPDPVSTSAEIRFALPQSGMWKLRVVDMLGRTVLQESSTSIIAGEQQIKFEASKFTQGTYRCIVESAWGSSSRMMVVVH